MSTRLLTGLALCCLTGGLASAQAPAVTPLYPVRGDTLVELYPSFNWTPPLATTPVPPVYQLRLVEVLAGQTPEAAIQQNPDVWRATNVRTNLCAYPITAPPLGKNKTYAWQVTTQTGRTIGAGEQNVNLPLLTPGEVSYFVFNDDMSDEQCTPTLYKQLDSRFYVFNDVLRFRLPAEAAGRITDFSFAIYNLRQDLVTPATLPVQAGNGAGEYNIALVRYEAFRKKTSKNQFYVLKATSPSGEVYQLKFTNQ